MRRATVRRMWALRIEFAPAMTGGKEAIDQAWAEARGKGTKNGGPAPWPLSFGDKMTRLGLPEAENLRKVVDMPYLRKKLSLGNLALAAPIGIGHRHG